MSSVEQNQGDSLPDTSAEPVSTKEVIERLDRLWPRPISRAGPASLESETMVGRYEIRQALGSGSFGVVYSAYDSRLNRDVALKLPRPEALIDRDKGLRFAREAQAAASLNHPAIVQIYEADFEGPAPYIASAYCPGPDLQRWLDENEKVERWESATRLVARLADGVHHAHMHGVFHRDLKPSNVLLFPNSSALDADDKGINQALDEFSPALTDFGLAKLVESSLLDTRSSLLIGTPLYMAPEQLEPRRMADQFAATDVYSLGYLLYELLVGHPPIEGVTCIEIVDRLRRLPPPRLRRERPECPRDLEIVCARCLEKVPELRYQSAADLAADLRACVAGKSISGVDRKPIIRLLYWAKLPQRIRDAAVFSIYFQAVLVLWMFVLFAVAPQYHSIPHPQLRSMFLQAAALAVLVNGTLIAISWQVLRGKRWAVPAGLALTALHTTLPIVCLMTGEWFFATLYSDSIFFPVTIYTLLFMGYLVQVVLYVFAFIANRAQFPILHRHNIEQ